MSLRQLEITNRENVHARPSKLKELQSKNQPFAKPRRPALAEVGNKIHIPTNDSGKQNITVKNVAVKKAAVKKTVPSVTNETIKTNVIKITKPNQKSSVPEKKSIDESRITNKIKEVAYSSNRLEAVVQLDEKEKNDPLLVTEYVQEIYSYLHDMEVKYSVQPSFLKSHSSTPRMRQVLINWLVEVHINFAFLPETLHLAVAILDRYLQADKTVGHNNLQLVGVTALYLAGKYEEMYVPELSDFEYVVDYGFKKDQILKMEVKILHKLDWCLGRPLSIHFLRRYSKVANVQAEHHTLGKYLLELALIEYELCHFPPSLLAAAAICLSIAILNDLTNIAPAWTEQLSACSSYTYSDIRPVTFALAQTLLNMETSKYQSIRSKYAGSNFGKISMNPKLKGTLVKCLANKARKSTSKSSV